MKRKEDWASPSSSEFAASIEGATRAIARQRESGSIVGGKVLGSFLEIPHADRVVIVSDLHGDYECLSAILEAIDYENFVSHDSNKLVFLGDYIDRGSNSIGVLHRICELKLEYPEAVVMMRGNHEAPSEFPFSAHDFPFQLVDRYEDSIGRTIYRKALLLFKELATATTLSSSLLLVHGGLPTDEQVQLDHRSLLGSAQQNHTRNRVLEEVLWNDPRQITSADGWEKSRRGIGRHFGESVTRRWLDVSTTKCVVRGHEPCQGYRIDHSGCILTLFSCQRPYPAYRAAYLSVEAHTLAAISSADDLVPFIRYPLSP